MLLVRLSAILFTQLSAVEPIRQERIQSRISAAAHRRTVPPAFWASDRRARICLFGVATRSLRLAANGRNSIIEPVRPGRVTASCMPSSFSLVVMRTIVWSPWPISPSTMFRSRESPWPICVLASFASSSPVSSATRSRHLGFPSSPSPARPSQSRVSIMYSVLAPKNLSGSTM